MLLPWEKIPNSKIISWKILENDNSKEAIWANLHWYFMRGGHRPLVWIHIVMALIGICIILICFVEALLQVKFSKVLACRNILLKRLTNNEGMIKPKSCAMQVYESVFTLDGEFYLVKMYVFTAYMF